MVTFRHRSDSIRIEFEIELRYGSPTGENLVPEPTLQVQTSAAGQKSSKRRDVIDARPALSDAVPAPRRFDTAWQDAGQRRLSDVDDAGFGCRHRS